MNKKYIIRKNEEIQKILQNSKKIVNKYFVIYYSKNNSNYNRYCISVSKKIGKAHTRNLYKRRIKDILSKNDINLSMDYVIILKDVHSIIKGAYMQNVNNENLIKISEFLNSVDGLIDGKFILGQRDVTLKLRGSSNQRVIDCKKSLTENKIILKED